jgi:hypothetical protein
MRPVSLFSVVVVGFDVDTSLVTSTTLLSKDGWCFGLAGMTGDRTFFFFVVDPCIVAVVVGPFRVGFCNLSTRLGGGEAFFAFESENMCEKSMRPLPSFALVGRGVNISSGSCSAASFRSGENISVKSMASPLVFSTCVTSFFIWDDLVPLSSRSRRCGGGVAFFSELSSVDENSVDRSMRAFPFGLVVFIAVVVVVDDESSGCSRLNHCPLLLEVLVSTGFLAVEVVANFLGCKGGEKMGDASVFSFLDESV